jgi:hypothetical protein
VVSDQKSSRYVDVFDRGVLIVVGIVVVACVGVGLGLMLALLVLFLGRVDGGGVVDAVEALLECLAHLPGLFAAFVFLGIARPSDLALLQVGLADTSGDSTGD